MENLGEMSTNYGFGRSVRFKRDDGSMVAVEMPTASFDLSHAMEAAKGAEPNTTVYLDGAEKLYGRG